MSSHNREPMYVTWMTVSDALLPVSSWIPTRLPLDGVLVYVREQNEKRWRHISTMPSFSTHTRPSPTHAGALNWAGCGEAVWQQF